MKLFSFLKNKKSDNNEVIKIAEDNKEDKSGQFVQEFNKYLVDDLLIIGLPVEWIPFESDRFRAKTSDDKLQMSIVNYQINAKDLKIDAEFFKGLKLELYDKFVNEGEYEPYDDLKVTDSFICKSFKVDEETQYYYTTSRVIDDMIVTTDIIVRELGEYNDKMQPLLQTIGATIEVN